MIINNKDIKLDKNKKFIPIGIINNKNIPNNYLINEDGYILDTITGELVNYYQNEYGRVYVLLREEKVSVPLIVATKFLPNPGNYKYAIRKDQSTYDFSINNVTIVYFTSKFTKHFKDIPSEIFNEGNYFNKIYIDLDELITFIKNF